MSSRRSLRPGKNFLSNIYSLASHWPWWRNRRGECGVINFAGPFMAHLAIMQNVDAVSSSCRKGETGLMALGVRGAKKRRESSSLPLRSFIVRWSTLERWSCRYISMLTIVTITFSPRELKFTRREHLLCAARRFSLIFRITSGKQCEREAKNAVDERRRGARVKNGRSTTTTASRASCVCALMLARCEGVKLQTAVSVLTSRAHTETIFQLGSQL